MMRYKHPGSILYTQYMQPLGLSMADLARFLKVSPQRVHQIVTKKRGISTDTALRLEILFEPSAEQWLELQTLYELGKAREKLAESIVKAIKSHTVFLGDKQAA